MDKLSHPFVVMPEGACSGYNRHKMPVSSCATLDEAVDYAVDRCRTGQCNYVVLQAIRFVQKELNPVEIIDLGTGEITS